LILFLCGLWVVLGNSPLTFTHVSPKKLAGTWLEADGSGLIFESEENSLSLWNIQGKQILEVFPESTSNNEPTSFSITVMGRKHFNNETLIQNADEYLQEATALIDLAKFLGGSLGITGPAMPGAMGLYKMALGYSKYVERHGIVKKRGMLQTACECNCPASIVDCPARPPSCCDCLGQCGACGSCWSWVCESCCWELGCCGHDICCYFSSASCLFPTNLKCDQPYTCSGNNPDTSCCRSGRGEPNQANYPCNTNSRGWCTCGASCCKDSRWSC